MNVRMKTRRLPGIDAAWLRMDRPSNRMIVTGLFFFAEPISAERIRELLATRLLRYRRFRDDVFASISEQPLFPMPEQIPPEPL